MDLNLLYNLFPLTVHTNQQRKFNLLVQFDMSYNNVLIIYQLVSFDVFIQGNTASITEQLPNIGQLMTKLGRQPGILLQGKIFIL